MKINGQLQHIAISSDNWRSITTHCDQFLLLKVNYNTLRSVLTIKGQLQDVAISSDNLRSIATRCDQFWQLKVKYNTLRSVMTIKAQLQCATCHWQALSYNIVSSTPCQRGIQTHNVSGDKNWLLRYICNFKSYSPYDNDGASLIQEDIADFINGLV
jgi:hypothetical protein